MLIPGEQGGRQLFVYFYVFSSADSGKQGGRHLDFCFCLLVSLGVQIPVSKDSTVLKKKNCADSGEQGGRHDQLKYLIHISEPTRTY